MKASYLYLQNNELAYRAAKARERAKACDLCPWKCGVNRVKGEVGRCNIGSKAYLASANLHFGEEPPISGTRGSGTLFFAGCNLACVFCQNYPISQLCQGKPVSPKELGHAMLVLEQRGAHNINLVTPSHVIWPILEALVFAVDWGLKIPIVYNSSGYDDIKTLQLLDGIVDIYMPDLKYADDKKAERFSSAKNYWKIATSALKEMHSQVRDLVVNEHGVAQRGLLVRHLVLPGNIAGTKQVLCFLAEQSVKTYVSLMRQYFPANRAREFPPLDRGLTDDEWNMAVNALKEVGLKNGWVQDK